MERLQQGLECRSSVHSVCESGLMGPTKVSIECEQSQRLMWVMQEVAWQWIRNEEEMIERQK